MHRETATRRLGPKQGSLRPTVFASNFAGMWSQQAQSADVIFGPFASASTAVIADRDISAVAARALLADELLGRKVALTGPQALTNAELVEVLGTVLNRPLRYQEVPPDAVRAQFSAIGFPAQFADAYLGLLAQTIDEPATVTTEVERILGRPAESFADWPSASRVVRSAGGHSVLEALPVGAVGEHLDGSRPEPG